MEDIHQCRPRRKGEMGYPPSSPFPLSLVDYDSYAFCQALYKGIEGEGWGELYDAYKETSRAVGVKKPQEAQKAKALWKMKTAKDAGEEHYDPTREDNIWGGNET